MRPFAAFRTDADHRFGHAILDERPHARLHVLLYFVAL